MARRQPFILTLALGVALAIAAISPLWAQDAKSFAGKKPGDERNDNVLEMKFCWCPPGKFVMGSPKDEPGREDREDQVQVTLTRGFWMGKYEVTQGEWQRVMETNPSSLKGRTLPVEYVLWTDTTMFCEKLTKLERDRGKLTAGWEYRLPTEAQWEYACRAGCSSIYSFGDDPKKLDGYVWYGQNSGLRTHAVGQKKPNHWGLHDMHGNVFEWCRDRYEPKLSGGTDPEVTRKSPTRTRVFRGGSWLSPTKYCRSAYRFRNGLDNQDGNLGFRVVAVQRTGNML